MPRAFFFTCVLVAMTSVASAGDYSRGKKFYETIDRNDIAAVRTMLKEDPSLVNSRRHKSDWPPLFQAAHQDRIEIVALLIEYGADVNEMSGGSTALGLPDTVPTARLLIENGADVNRGVGIGHPALHGQAWSGSPEVIAFLIENGADINARDSWGRTALHWTEAGFNLEVVAEQNKNGSGGVTRDINGVLMRHGGGLRRSMARARVLIEHGADVNARDGQGRTLLHELAPKMGAAEFIRLLVDSGADVNAADGAGRTALKLALVLAGFKDGYQQNVDVLRELGGTEEATPRRFSFGRIFAMSSKAALVACEHEGAVRLWAPSKRSAPRVLGGRRGQVGALGFTEDGRMLAVADNRGISIWDTRRHKRKWMLSDDSLGRVASVALGRNGRLLAVADGGKFPRLWDLGTGREMKLASRSNRVAGGTQCVAFSRKGLGLVSVNGNSKSSEVVLWSLGTRREVASRIVFGDTPLIVRPSPNGKTVAVGFKCGKVLLWVPESKDPPREYRVPGGYAVALDFSGDGELVAAGGAGGEVCVWRAYTGDRQQSRAFVAILKSEFACVTSLRFTGNGKLCAGSQESGEVVELEYPGRN